MELVESVVLKLDTWLYKELKEVEVASSCDHSDLGSDAVFTIWLYVASLTKS